MRIGTRRCMQHRVKEEYQLCRQRAQHDLMLSGSQKDSTTTRGDEEQGSLLQTLWGQNKTARQMHGLQVAVRHVALCSVTQNTR